MNLYGVVLLANGFLAAVILLVLIVASFGAWKVIQGWKTLLAIQEVHNSLVDSISKVDAKAQEALLRLDHVNNILGPKMKGPF